MPPNDLHDGNEQIQSQGHEEPGSTGVVDVHVMMPAGMNSPDMRLIAATTDRRTFVHMFHFPTSWNHSKSTDGLSVPPFNREISLLPNRPAVDKNPDVWVSPVQKSEGQLLAQVAAFSVAIGDNGRLGWNVR